MMQLPFAVTLNGIAPDIPGLLLDDVIEVPPTADFRTIPAAGGVGSFVIGTQRQALRVELRFRMPEAEPAIRMAALEQLRAWASGGGWLRLGCRPGWRLFVRCETLPAVGSFRDWSAAVSILLTACEVPFWMAESPLSVYAGEGTSVSAVLAPAGSAALCPLHVAARNCGSETLTRLQVVCAESVDWLQLTGLSVPPGDTVNIACDTDGRLCLRQNGSASKSLLSKRTADSSDLLRLVQRTQNHVTVTADQSVAVTLTAYARQI